MKCVQSLSGKWRLRQVNETNWIPATVPGGVHTDLLQAGLIPDPFFGDNERQVRWVAEADWEYEREFSLEPECASQEKIFLVCDGLDTLAQVFLNGDPVGETANMFCQHRWEVTHLLRPDENRLRIHFFSPVQYIATRQRERPLINSGESIPGGSYLRKAPYQFGWDWGPQLPPIGIWKEIRLEAYSRARLASVHLRQRHEPEKVTLGAEFILERWGPGELAAVLSLTGPDGEKQEARFDVRGDRATGRIEIENPQLWWPNGFGGQPLYQVEAQLLDEERILDRREIQVGLRTLAIEQLEDRWGRSFTFVVNGRRIFAKGANWIPADSFPTRITEERLEHLLQSAALAHQNMLRIWGGGYYEDERFYDLCDRYGLLVWQDFMFSCAVYPFDEPGFLASVQEEIVQNVRRLRHRACLALWCGNNEMELGWETWGWDRPALADLKAEYERFFYHTLPAWISAEDPDHAYWPSSPSSNTPFVDADGQKQGDAHYWAVWHERKPFSAYREQYPRFMSEFGFQSLPAVETIRAFARPEDWNLTAYIMEHHQRSPVGNGLIISQMTDNFRLPKDFESLVYLSMVLQAEGIRYGVEHWRRSRERVSGTLYWQLNDCWPAVSWSSLDYYGRWKALHYAARRFYAPILLSLVTGSDVVGIHLTNDRLEPWQGQVRWSFIRLDGEVLKAGEQEATIGPLASREAFSVPVELPEPLRREVVFLCERIEDGETVGRSLGTFVPDKHLSLVDPQLAVALSLEGRELSIEVRSQSLARFVELSLPNAEVIFSDNYFDLPAGRANQVTCPLPEGWSLQRAQDSLRLRSLYHSYR